MFGTQLPKNRVIIAAAGSRKTTQLVEEALAAGDKRILVTTFTNENLNQLSRYFVQKHGCVPSNVVLLSWFTFLLQDCARPYQRSLTPGPRVRSILFDDPPDAVRYVRKVEPGRYYLTANKDIYRDRVAEYVCDVNARSGGLVIGRLERIYDKVFIDELQDFAGYDLEMLDSMLASRLEVVCVGDPRQATYSTNRSRKNKQFKGSHIVEWLNQQVRTARVGVEERNECHRCNQAICDFADGLYPDMPKTKSMNFETTSHDGVIAVPRADVLNYVQTWSPVILRYNKSVDTMGLRAINFGVSKGQTFDRVLIFPTQPMLKYLGTKDPAKVGDRPKFYVAVTRARFSVAFVVD